MKKRIKVKQLLAILLIVFLAIQIPKYILSARSQASGESSIASISSKNTVNTVLNFFVIDAFSGNYFQLVTLVTQFREYRNGETLWSFFAPLIPTPLVTAVGIDKGAVSRNNSAFILADFLKSRESAGLRTGVMGEFYVNFGLWGFLLMPFWAIILHLVNLAFKRYDRRDFRYFFIYPISAFFVYAVVGQPDQLASSLYNAMLIMITLYMFSRKYSAGSTFEDN